jgi:hypothetical protein
MSRYFSRCHSGILPHGMRGYIGGYAHIADAWNALAVFDEMIMGRETAPNYNTLSLSMFSRHAVVEV